MRAHVALTAGLAALLSWPTAARAQLVFESVGVRALGMAGAFTAVADDATATYWNPAGLASGAPAGMTVEWNRFQTGNQKAPPGAGASLRNGSYASLGTWPLGVSYGRFRTTALVSDPSGGVAAEDLEIFHLGGTVLQTIVRHVVLGGTFKYLRGTFVTGPSTGLTAGDAIESIRQADGSGQNKFDIDAGLMLDFDKVRLGVTSRNLTEPQFQDRAGNAISLQRQTRAGVAVLPTAGLTLAMDVDLDTVDLRDGLRRMIALGGETRLGTRVALRGGVRWNLKGDHQTVGAFGGSVSLRSKFWLDGYYSQGRTNEDRGFGIGLRAGY
jgi:hypothetical protein